MVQIPVYAFTGFLDSGKTKFIQETLEDERFNAGERTLLLVFEEGEEEYDFSTYPHKNVYLETLDQQTVTTKELQALAKKYRAERVVAELNGMQQVGDLYMRFPENWAVAQEVMFADSTTIMTYNANMRNLVMDKLVGAQMVVFNRLEKGADVIILESQAAVGGNSVRATGGMNAADTPAQDENEFGESAGVEKTLKTARTTYADNVTITKLAEDVEKQWADYQANPVGYFDSDELMELDTMIGGKGINNPELVEELADESADGVEWLKKYGINLTSVGSFGGASVKRIHRPVNAEGKTIAVGSYMIPLLEKACEENDKISIQLETTATTILTDENGKAVGVKAVGATGNEVTVNAKAVILATGGFGANLDMVAELVPALKGFMTTNAAGAQGQGIEMAQALGAATVDMDQIQIHPTVQFDTAALITEGLRGDGAVLINADGKRFIDEVGTRDVVSAAEIAQPGSYSYLVVDQAMLDKSSVIAGYVKRGFVFQGNTYEELAEALGVDAATFAETMNTWNTYVEAKNDPDFGRTSFAQPLNTAPYYAIKVTAGVHHTMGGLVINTDTEVLKADGTAIAGLYAAGEVTGGVHGANRLGGNAVADFVVFGRIAGEEAAEYALGE